MLHYNDKERMVSVKNDRLSLMRGLALVLICAVVGCGNSAAQKELVLSPTYNNLRHLSLAYSQATSKLGRPPVSVEEIRPFLSKLGNPKELLQSPIDGAPFVIRWGVDMRRMRTADGNGIIWAYAANPHDGKRWVLQERHPAEMAEDDFRSASFAPGMKKPF